MRYKANDYALKVFVSAYLQSCREARQKPEPPRATKIVPMPSKRVYWVDQSNTIKFKFTK